MRTTDKALVISGTRHTDNRHIIRLYTRNHGLVTVSASVGRSPSAKVRPSAVQPLAFADVVMTLKAGKDVQTLTEASVYFSPELSASMPKLAVAMFMNELLVRSLKEQGPNERLYDFIEHCFDLLQRSEPGFVTLHLYFMRELAKHLGFDPQNDREGDNIFFDCREGGFTSFGLSFPLGLNEADSALFSRFLASSFLSKEWTSRERQVLLDSWLAYYQLHVPGFNQMKSLSVVRELLAV